MIQRGSGRSVLWWGRFDPDYSRNRILRQAFETLGWRVVDFHPRVSQLGDLEAFLKAPSDADLVWVPCFRQRDLAAASRWAKRRRLPLIFDPLISSYDKQVFERAKIPADSPRAEALRRGEAELFASADIVIADTGAHADFFHEALGKARDKIAVVPVGAEESLFSPKTMTLPQGDAALEVLFYGSFIALQAPQVIVDAALMSGGGLRWTLLGDGPLRCECEARAGGDPRIRFEDPIPLEALPARIRKAQVLLGIFGGGQKSGRVIPNKVYQSLACGRPVITRKAAVYPEPSGEEAQGLILIEPENPKALAAAVKQLAGDPSGLPLRGEAAAGYYRRHFGQAAITAALQAALERLAAR